MSSAAFLSRFGSGSDEESELQAETPQDDLGLGGVSAFINRFAGVSESYWFYDNTVEIKFDKVNHIYYRVGELGELIPLLNVSTVSKIVDRSNALIPWAAKVTIEKFLRIIPTVVLPGAEEPVIGIPQMTFEEFSKLAMQAKTAHQDKLEDAGTVGTMAHNWLESYIKAVMAKDQAAIDKLLATMCTDPRGTSCAQAALSWIKKHNVRWKDTERKVFSKKYDCSGTLDGRCIVDSCDDPACCPKPFKDRHSLCDWKSSNYLYIEFLFQVAAYYFFFLEEFPNEVLEDIWILRLGKEDGEFQPWHLEHDEVPACFEGFLACLDLKRKTTALEEHMSEVKAHIRQVKKEQRASEREKRKAEEKAKKLEEKIQKKAEREAEKARVKAEAKAERERLKKEKKLAKILKVGALRYMAGDEEVIAQPGDPTFSTVTMCATHFWNGTTWESTGPEEGCSESTAGSSDVTTSPTSVEVGATSVTETGPTVTTDQFGTEEDETPVRVFSIPTEE